MVNNAPLLQLDDVHVHFPVGPAGLFSPPTGLLRAVNGVSFTLDAGETLGLVGESGCGKSTTARAILMLNPPTSGRISFEGEELAADPSKMRDIYRKLQIVYQDPYASLNPRMTIGDIIGEPLKIFRVARGAERRERVSEIMETVGLDPRFIARYPHEFSGGQRQRIGIARALSVNPSLVIADEPVSALDVSIRAQIVNLLEDLQQRFGLAYLFIAHDLSMVKHISRRVAVMYLGRIVEIASAADIYDDPLHPYTEALLSAIPIPDPAVEAKRRRIILKGDVPAPDIERKGCDFASRCPRRFDRCEGETPQLTETGAGRRVACFLHE